MKKLPIAFVLLFAVSSLLLQPIECRAGTLRWRLYDNFNSGVLDTERWDVDDSSANISIENGQAKFEHQSGFPGDASLLIIKKKTAKVRGIKAKVTVVSCSGAVRGIIGAFAGKLGENYVWSNFSVRADENTIRVLGFELEPVTFDDLNLLFGLHFVQPLDIIGNTFSLKATFKRTKAIYRAGGLGVITFQYPEITSPSDEFLNAIGTRSPNGDGPCVVKFDDVYVLRR